MSDAAPTKLAGGSAAAVARSPVRRPGVQRVAIVLAAGSARGGKERVVQHLARELTGLGVAPLLVNLEPAGEFLDEVRAAGLPACALGSSRGGDLRALIRLVRRLRRFRPDIVNVHDRASLPYAALAGLLAGRPPIVMSCHGLLLKGLGRARWPERWAMRRVSAVTAVSLRAADEYGETMGWRGPVSVIDNGVPVADPADTLRRRTREALGLDDSTFALLAVGNLKPEKGYEDLLDALSLLRQRAPGRALTVLIAGGRQDESYARMLDGQQSRLGVSETVRFLGFRQDGPALYAAADAFVLHSRKEGLPMVLLEAMAAGKPVVATAVGGVPGVVSDGVSGLLVPPREPAQLADAILRLMTDPDLASRLAQCGRQVVGKRYGSGAMARRYLDVYERVRSSAPGAKEDPS